MEGMLNVHMELIDFQKKKIKVIKQALNRVLIEIGDIHGRPNFLINTDKFNFGNWSSKSSDGDLEDAEGTVAEEDIKEGLVFGENKELILVPAGVPGVGFGHLYLLVLIEDLNPSEEEVVEMEVLVQIMAADPALIYNHPPYEE